MDINSDQNVEHTIIQLDDQLEINSNTSTHSDTHSPVQELRRSNRNIKTPNKFKNFYHAPLPRTKTHLVNLGTQSCKYPLSNFLSFDKLSPKHRAYTIPLSEINEPTSYHEAIKHKHWRQAITEELAALEENRTWTIVSKPPNAKAIGCRFVFKTNSIRMEK